MVNRDNLEELDKVIKKCVKSWLYLPSRASNEILYIPHRVGGLNLMPVKELASICDVVEAVHLLYSKDPQVAAVAHSTLQDDVRQKTKQPPTPETVKDYLDGSTEGVLGSKGVTYSSIWTRLRISTRHLRRMFLMEWSCDSATHRRTENTTSGRGEAAEERLSQVPGQETCCEAGPGQSLQCLQSVVIVAGGMRLHRMISGATCIQNVRTLSEITSKCIVLFRSVRDGLPRVDPPCVTDYKRTHTCLSSAGMFCLKFLLSMDDRWHDMNYLQPSMSIEAIVQPWMAFQQPIHVCSMDGERYGLNEKQSGKEPNVSIGPVCSVWDDPAGLLAI
uniref:KRR-R motif-containing protein 1 n=1 Tax=Panagrellus redivivus TaxID=6233 RepID=A0A7E4VZN2_PANRE